MVRPGRGEDGPGVRTCPDVAQLVILGAGLDTGAYGLPGDARVPVFEVDTPRTLAVKRETLAKAGIDPRAVTFVPADFETEDWLSRLVAAGFDPDERTLFLWEGVTMYLRRPCGLLILTLQYARRRMRTARIREMVER